MSNRGLNKKCWETDPKIDTLGYASTEVKYSTFPKYSVWQNNTNSQKTLEYQTLSGRQLYNRVCNHIVNLFLNNVVAKQSLLLII